MNLIDEVLTRCWAAPVDREDWIAIASTLPHITVRCTNSDVRDVLRTALIQSDDLVVAEYGLVDLRVSEA